jgi:hypothetical protein
LTVAVDLIVRPNGWLTARAPSFPAWHYTARRCDTFKHDAEESLRAHVASVMGFSWWGWSGTTDA